LKNQVAETKYKFCCLSIEGVHFCLLIGVVCRTVQCFSASDKANQWPISPAH